MQDPTTLMTTTLTLKSTLPENYLRRAWMVARTSTDLRVKAVLARRADLPAEVVTGLAADPSPQVRTALLLNPDLDAAVRRDLLEEETRTSVLLTLLRSTRAPAGTLLRAEVVFSDKPTATLGAALLEHEVSVGTLAALVLLMAARADSLSGRKAELLNAAGARLTGSDAGIVAAARVVAANVTNPEVALLVLESDHLDATSEAHALRVVLGLPGSSSLGMPATVSTSSVLERSAMRHAGAPELKEVLRDIVTERGSAFLAQELALDAGVAVEVLRGDGDGLDELVDSLLFDPDLDLEPLVSRYGRAGGAPGRAVGLGSLGSERVVLRRLLRRPDLSVSQAVRLLDQVFAYGYGVEDLKHSYPVHLVRELVERMNDVTVTAAAVAAAPQVALAEKWHLRHEGTLELVGETLLDAYREGRAVGLNSWAIQTLEAALGHVLLAPGFPADLAVEFLPYRLCLTNRSQFAGSATAQEWLARRTSEHFGNDMAAWETFDALGQNYEGTLGELLRASSAL